jgi:hypothetical protein
MSKNQSDLFTADSSAVEKADDTDAPKAGSPRIEDNLDRYRAQAMLAQESVSKNWSGAKGQGVYRLTRKGEWMYLEQMRLGKDGEAFAWSGVMFPESDMYEITGVMVKASKAKAGK